MYRPIIAVAMLFTCSMAAAWSPPLACPLGQPTILCGALIDGPAVEPAAGHRPPAHPPGVTVRQGVPQRGTARYSAPQATVQPTPAGTCPRGGPHVPGKVDKNGRLHCAKCGRYMRQ